MNALRQKAVSTTNFVKKHRVALAVTGTSIFWLYVWQGSTESLREFLKEHDLYETYYYNTTEDL